MDRRAERRAVHRVPELSPRQALALRMRSLLLRPHPAHGPAGRPQDVAGVVTWFGAMQSQDLASGLWSLGLRLPGVTRGGVEAALERREALRTWPMRGTVHLIPSRDAHWMLEVLGARPLAAAASRRAFLGLDQKVADRAADVLGAALAGGGRMTRAECVATLAAAGIEGAGQRGYHLLWYASQRGITCIAPNVDGEQTFVLLDEWVPDPVRPDRDDALATIAVRYFRSHGPTTRQDFAGWSGLTAADAKRGIEAAGERLAVVRVSDRDMLLDPQVLDSAPDGIGRAALSAAAPDADVPDEFLTLPGFDEYLLGYKDRSLMVADEHRQAIIPGGNGVFQATVVRDGRVVATWKRTTSRGRTTVTVRPLRAFGRPELDQVATAFHPYERYLGQPVVVTWDQTATA